MKCWSFPGGSAAMAIGVIFFFQCSTIVPPGAMAAVVDHTFVVSMMT
jgi:laccase